MYAITLICSYFRDNNINTQTNKTKHVMKKKVDLESMLIDFYNYCDDNGKDKSSVAEAMLWMRKVIMDDMKNIVDDANALGDYVFRCSDECHAELDKERLTDFINSEIMEMY